MCFFSSFCSVLLSSGTDRWNHLKIEGKLSMAFMTGNYFTNNDKNPRKMSQRKEGRSTNKWLDNELFSFKVSYLELYIICSWFGICFSLLCCLVIFRFWLYSLVSWVVKSLRTAISLDANMKNAQVHKNALFKRGQKYRMAQAVDK